MKNINVLKAMSVSQLKKEFAVEDYYFNIDCFKDGQYREKIAVWDSKEQKDVLIKMLTEGSYENENGEFSINTENTAAILYCLIENRDKAGIGSVVPYDSKEEALEKAKADWDALSPRDKKSYLKDSSGEYCVAPLEFDEEGNYDLSSYTPVWNAFTEEA